MVCYDIFFYQNQLNSLTKNALTWVETVIQVGTSVSWLCVKQELSGSSGNFDIFLHRDIYFT